VLVAIVCAQGKYARHRADSERNYASTPDDDPERALRPPRARAAIALGASARTGRRGRLGGLGRGHGARGRTDENGLATILLRRTHHETPHDRFLSLDLEPELVLAGVHFDRRTGQVIGERCAVDRELDRVEVVAHAIPGNKDDTRDGQVDRGEPLLARRSDRSGTARRGACRQRDTGVQELLSFVE
jgi:hypothetical protein